MAKVTEFYKGRRKKKNYAIIPFAVVLFLFSVSMVLFYGMQKYAVISENGVSVELPILNEGKVIVNEQGEEIHVFETVDASITFEQPDYSHIEATAGKNIKGMRAIFVPAADLNKDALDTYVSRLNTGNALVLEMKPRTGILNWPTQSGVAFNYGLTQDNEVTQNIAKLVQSLKERKVYVATQISCCLDESFASRSTTVTLRNQAGMNYSDDSGLWLDPYNLNVRQYIIDLVGELFDMGFDEVILADLVHPTLEEGVSLLYTRQMSTEPSAVNAVCGFAMAVADAYSERSGKLSIYLDSAPALVKTDTSNGQDGPLFMKMFDRIYYRTDKYAYSYNLSDIKPSVKIGEPVNRFVPVVVNYLPDDAANCSWVLVDSAEDW